MVPLNQVYKEKITFEQYPHIKKTFDELTEYAHKNDFVRTVNNIKFAKGRRYDCAILYNNNVDFKDKIVCELGARDGIFSSWLTKEVKKIYVSDYFEEWGKGTKIDLGQIDYWKKIWEDAAYDKSKMVIENQDITKLTYPDNFFDIVICTSVIEHTFVQNDHMGDMACIREMARITKPGGKILLSTDMGEVTKWIGGTLYYSEVDLFDRIINPSRCILNGNYDFNLDDENNTNLHTVRSMKKATSVVLSLIKPE